MRLSGVLQLPRLLSPAQRVGLAEALAVSGQPLALFPDELGDLALPTDPDVVISLLPLLFGPLEQPLPATVMDQRLGATFPLLSSSRARIDAARIPQRLASTLESQHLISWRSVAKCRPADMAQWPRIGVGAISALLHAALLASVRAAADIIGAAAVPRPNPSRRVAPPPAPVLAAASSVLKGVGPARDRIVFERLSLDGTHRPPDIARELGVGVDRIRQLRQRAESNARELVIAQPDLHRVARQLGEELGHAAPLSAINTLLGAFGLPPGGDGRTALVLWLAGPYRPSREVPGWLTRGPKEPAALTAQLLRRDGGVQNRLLLRKELRHLGILDTHVDAWLEAQPVGHHGENTVYLVGSPATVAERILQCIGTAMSPAACRSWAADLATPLDVWQAAMQRDRRFVHVGDHRFELAEWGSDAVEVVRKDRMDQGWANRLPTVDVSGCGAGSEETPAPTLAVTVDRNLLAGHSGPAPFSLMVRLGITVGARRSFATRYGPMLLTNAADGPRHGTLRPIAVACGATPGDFLMLTFEEGSPSVEVKLQRAPRASRVRG